MLTAMRVFASRLLGSFRRQRFDAGIEEEFQSHLQMLADRFVSQGMTKAKALRAAKQQFGGVAQVEEQLRERSGLAFLDSLWQDLCYGLRQLRRSPGFTVVAIITLALGIGGNTAIFGIVDSFFLRSLPVHDPNQLTVLAFRQGHGPLNEQFSLPDIHDICAQTKGVFSGVLGYTPVLLDGLSHNGKAELISTNYVTGNYFSMLGIQPYLGRFIFPPEGQTAGTDPILVLSYSYWKTRFGGDRSIIGKNVQLNGHPITIIGVAPPGFQGLEMGAMANVQSYVPFSMFSTYELGGPKSNFLVDRSWQTLHTLARLQPRVSLTNAAVALNVVGHRLSTQYPDTDRALELSVYAERFARPDVRTSGTLIKAAGLFLVLVGLVLLLVCVNIVSLLLVRATVREREMAVRAALGAKRSRLIRQLLTESLLLASFGGVAGILLGLLTARTIASIQLHTFMPTQLGFAPDWRVLDYGLFLALSTGILVGIFPALRACGSRMNNVLHESSRSVTEGKTRLRSGLVALQVAGSLMLMVIAALFTESLANVQHTNLGFDPHNVVNLAMDPSEAGYDQTRGLAFYTSLLERVKALRGVQSASLAASTPMSDYWYNGPLKIADYPNPPGDTLPVVAYNVVSPDFFETMRIPIVSGRAFTGANVLGSPYVAIVSQSFAEHFWPGRNAIGERFARGKGPVRKVVGVAKDSRFSSLTGPIPPYYYLPVAQEYRFASLQILQIRGTVPRDTLIREVQGITHRLAPEIPVFNIQSMSDSLDTLSAFLLFRLGAVVAASLGFLGLVIAAVGVYGVISYSVSQRTHEIGIRVAFGAQPLQILKIIFREGAFIVAAGVIAGAAAALLLAHFIANFLVGVSFADPLTYLGVAVLLTLVAIVACYIPARRAMRVDPMVALRHE